MLCMAKKLNIKYVQITNCDFKLLIYELYTWKKNPTPHFMSKLFPAI